MCWMEFDFSVANFVSFYYGMVAYLHVCMLAQLLGTLNSRCYIILSIRHSRNFKETEHQLLAIGFLGLFG